MAKATNTSTFRAKPKNKLRRHTKHINKESYFEPTPKRFRVLGDSIAGASLFVAGLNLDHPKLMLICGVAGAVGKFVTNFFGDETS
jgi:hypothetical protein